MFDAVRDILLRDPRVAFALVFGSRATGRARPDSDLDIAVGVPAGTRLTAADIGGLVSTIEAVAGCQVDIVIVSEASIPLRFAIFRDGTELIVRDRTELVAQKARAIVDWLDFQPIHRRMAEGALRAAARG